MKFTLSVNSRADGTYECTVKQNLTISHQRSYGSPTEAVVKALSVVQAKDGGLPPFASKILELDAKLAETVYDAEVAKRQAAQRKQEEAKMRETVIKQIADLEFEHLKDVMKLLGGKLDRYLEGGNQNF